MFQCSYQHKEPVSHLLSSFDESADEEADLMLIVIDPKQFKHHDHLELEKGTLSWQEERQEHPAYV